MCRNPEGTPKHLCQCNSQLLCLCTGLLARNTVLLRCGEPGGTAGKPILNSILRNELSGVLIIVTRYFGGIKLGVKGLIEAYTQSAQAAIDASERIPLILYHGFTITTDYAFVDGLRHQMAAFGALEITSDYTQRVCLNVNVPEESLAAFEDFLIGYQAMGRLIFIRED